MTQLSNSAILTLTVTLLLFSSLPPLVSGLEPFSAGLAVGAGMMLSAMWSARDKVVCQVIMIQ